jgi:site-specific DNA-methyltransferase (adenine-specific)
VKSGRLGASSLRELRAVLSRNEAAIGVLLTLHEPTEALLAEAARAGFYAASGGRYPRIQILTAAQLLGGRRVDVPRSNGPGLKRGKRGALGAIVERPALLYRASE